MFGFDGILLGQLRQQTGASIQLSGDSGDQRALMEQVCTISATFDLILKAFSLICRKLWDFISSLPGSAAPGSRALVIRLAVHASQCGSIIGKHGAKVNEIKHITGANIQISQENLPESTERCVEISGTGEACVQCSYHILTILQDSPARGEVLLYKPNSSSPGAENRVPEPSPNVPADDDWKPVFLCGEKAFVIVNSAPGSDAADYARLAPPDILSQAMRKTD